MKTVLIAGGTGYVGQHLEKLLIERGYHVLILTRKPRAENHVFWSPDEGKIDAEKCTSVDVLVNLCGEGINAKRWTAAQKEVLRNSRIELTKQLFALKDAFPALKQYVSASGISAYGFDDGQILHKETATFGPDFMSGLVREWEAAASLFDTVCKVACVRVAVTIEEGFGVWQQMSVPIRLGLGAPLGDGKQQIPWVATSDLARLFEHVIAHNLEGIYNSNAGNISNASLTKKLCTYYNRMYWKVGIPAWILKIVLGDMSEIALKGAKADNSKILTSGFEFTIKEVDDFLKRR